MRPKVSVIIPVYNAEKHLDETLDCVTGQTLKDIEIICVDNGSTDGSWSILEAYARKDPRLTALSHPEGFAGGARNAGIERATGEYLVFWDADDLFRRDALKLMYRQSVKDGADICICDGNQLFEDLGFCVRPGSYIRRKNLPEEIPFNRKTLPESILNITVEAPWNKMFKRTFVEKTGLQFECRRNGNDVFFVICSLCLADAITVVKEELVTYRKNQSASLVSTVSKSPVSPLEAWIESARFLSQHGAMPERSFANRALESIAYTLHNVRSFAAMKEALSFLNGEALECLGISGHDDDYFYIPWHGELVRHMTTDDAEDFLAWFAHLTYSQQTVAFAKLKRCEQDRDALRRRTMGGVAAGVMRKLKRVAPKRNLP